mgnify:CR=1 FL=1
MSSFTPLYYSLLAIDQFLLLILWALQISLIIQLQCLYDAGRSQNIQLLDLYCEALDPDSHSSRAVREEGTSSPRMGSFSNYQGGNPKRGSICQSMRKVR